jgi:transcription initiation factor TFIIE subunit alpha
MESLAELAKVTVRLFYEDRYAIVMDLFTRELVFRDDVLSYRLKMNAKELNKILAKLKEDRLLRVEVRFEKAISFDSGKPLTKSFYYLDYKQLVDVVKYKMYKIRKSFEDSMKNVGNQIGFSCAKCTKVYSPLEVQSMLNPATFLFNCELCDTELVEWQNTRIKDGPQEAHTRLMEQCLPLITLLKRTESLSIPQFNVSKWIDSNPDASSISLSIATAKMAATSPSQSDLPSASLLAEKVEEEVVDVDILNTDQEDAMRQEKSLQDKSKHFDNSVPAWHSHSTVTGQAIQQQLSEIKSTEPFKSAVVQKMNVMQTTQHQLEDDPIVQVEGISKRFSEVTELDKDLMTNEEYSKYYMILMQKQ